MGSRVLEERTCENCDGSCCAVFVLSEPYEKLVVQPERVTDGEFILDMLRPLTQVEVEQRVEALGIPGVLRATDQQRYTCRHWDEQTRLCTVYEQRPEMCRIYPRKPPCDYECEPGSDA